MNRQKGKWFAFFFILLALVFSSIWLTDLTAEQLLFNLHVSMKGANSSAVWRCLLFACGSSTAVLLAVLYGLKRLREKQPEHWLLRWLRKAAKRKRTVTAVSLIVCLLCMNCNLEFVQFLKNQTVVTTIYQNEYVAPEKVAYQFPEQKRNLIYIFLESMEVTYTNGNEGGARPTDLIPELRGMAQNHVNFSPNSGFGGGYTLPGTTWTMARHGGADIRPAGKTAV